MKSNEIILLISIQLQLGFKHPEVIFSLDFVKKVNKKKDRP